MAMSISGLKNLIISNMEAQFGTPDDSEKLEKFATAMATAIYTEITTNAQVPAGITVTTPDTLTGATTGTGTII